MVEHLIHFKGRGSFVFIFPLSIAFVLFVALELFNLTDRYIGAVSLLISAIIIFYIDYKREPVSTGIIEHRGKLQKGVNLFMWIDMRYCALVQGTAGLWMLIHAAARY